MLNLLRSVAHAHPYATFSCTEQSAILLHGLLTNFSQQLIWMGCVCVCGKCVCVYV